MDALIQSKTALIALWVLALLLAERIRPQAPAPRAVEVPAGRFGWRRLMRNAGLWGINALLSPLVVLGVTALAAQHALDWRAEQPALLWLAIDLLILDAFLYWWHRANHELPVLWRFHEVHHLDRTLDVTTAFRFHFGEVVLSALARGAVVFLFGIPLATVIIFETLVALASAFHHSNLRLPRGFEMLVSLLIVTPSIHWVHHHRVHADTDSNYATVLSIWDRVFGSRSETRRTPDMPIGVEGRGERDFLRLLLRPFD